MKAEDEAWHISVSTVAGDGDAPEGFVDGDGRSARFHSPRSLAMDSMQNIIVADSGNHCIRMISTAGKVVTIAGSKQGHQDGHISQVAFNYPGGVAVNSLGHILVADTNNHCIRIIEGEYVRTLAGIHGTSGHVDNSNGLHATFNYPRGIGVDVYDNVLVSDSENKCVRLIVKEAPHSVTTLSENSSVMEHPCGITFDCLGNAIVSDPWAHGLHHLSHSDKYITSCRCARGVAVDGVGVLVVACSADNCVRVLNDEGQCIVTVGKRGYQDGDGGSTCFLYPTDVLIDQDSLVVYVADTQNRCIRKIVGLPLSRRDHRKDVMRMKEEIARRESMVCASLKYKEQSLADSLSNSEITFRQRMEECEGLKLVAEAEANRLRQRLCELESQIEELSQRQKDRYANLRLKLGRTDISSYRLHGILGDGCEGIVFLCVVCGLYAVALKLLRNMGNDDEWIINSFEAEYKVLQSIGKAHVNVVPILHEFAGQPTEQMLQSVVDPIVRDLMYTMDPITHKAVPRLSRFVVMPVYQCSLDRYLKQIGEGLSDKLALKMIIDIGSGLDFLHGCHAVHRDVKLDNIMVDFYGELDTTFRLVLTDFGSSALTDEEYMVDVQRRGFGGNRGHQAPEVILGLIEGAANVCYRHQHAWELGVAAYEIMSGGAHPYIDYMSYDGSASLVCRQEAIEGFRSEVVDIVAMMLKELPEERIDISSAMIKLKHLL